MHGDVVVVLNLEYSTDCCCSATNTYTHSKQVELTDFENKTKKLVLHTIAAAISRIVLRLRIHTIAMIAMGPHLSRSVDREMHSISSGPLNL